jgi:cysteinyl-tRNA synthetase
MGEQGADPHANLTLFTTYFTDLFLTDLSAVGIDPSQFEAMPRATVFIPQMQQLVREIHQAGFAYERDGSVYFNVAAFRAQHPYGRLFTIDWDNFKEGVRIDADEYDRESVSDFVLWKARKESEPFWDFDWSDAGGVRNLPGRPGWHLECSAMSRELIGPLPFDVHTGGVDLRFPHHEDELAQCCAAHAIHTGSMPFTEQANVWMHNEFLEVEGQKMAKRLGNFYVLDDLRKRGLDPLDVRLSLLGAHYRSVVNFTFDGVKGASAARKKVQEYIWELLENGERRTENGERGSGPLKRVFEALADDVHTPRALADLYSFVGEHPVSAMGDDEKSAVVTDLMLLNDVFNVWSFDERPVVDVPTAVQQLAEARWQARAAKNWAESDRLRDELLATGWTVKDGKEGYELSPAE